jgi:hypothetical protein
MSGLPCSSTVLATTSRPSCSTPANDLRWTGGIQSSRPAQQGPLVAGSTVERTARFLGRTFTYGYAHLAYVRHPVPGGVLAHTPG